MKNIKEITKNHPVITSGIIFGVLSLITNIIWITAFGMAHIYDIIHVAPTVLVYPPIIKTIGGLAGSEYLFLPLAIIIDVIIGLLIGLIVKHCAKTSLARMVSIFIAFAIYFIVITYQWLPIM